MRWTEAPTDETGVHGMTDYACRAVEGGLKAVVLSLRAEGEVLDSPLRG